jgi:hypothetical protein
MGPGFFPDIEKEQKFSFFSSRAPQFPVQVPVDIPDFHPRGQFNIYGWNNNRGKSISPDDLNAGFRTIVVFSLCRC